MSTKRQPPPRAAVGDALCNELETTIALLEAQGVSERRARSLATQHDRAKIAQQLAWLDYRKPRDRGATLATAITEDWSEPKAAVLERLRRRNTERTVEKELARMEAERDAAEARSREQAQYAVGSRLLGSARLAVIQAEATAAVEKTWRTFVPVDSPLWKRRASSGPFLAQIESCVRQRVIEEAFPTDHGPGAMGMTGSGEAPARGAGGADVIAP